MRNTSSWPLCSISIMKLFDFFTQFDPLHHKQKKLFWTKTKWRKWDSSSYPPHKTCFPSPFPSTSTNYSSHSSILSFTNKEFSVQIKKQQHPVMTTPTTFFWNTTKRPIVLSHKWNETSSSHQNETPRPKKNFKCHKVIKKNRLCFLRDFCIHFKSGSAGIGTANRSGIFHWIFISDSLFFKRLYNIHINNINNIIIINITTTS